MSGRASSMQREIQWTYKHLREEDILDMLAECEADENYSKSSAPGGLGVVGTYYDMNGNHLYRSDLFPVSTCSSTAHFSWQVLVQDCLVYRRFSLKAPLTEVETGRTGRWDRPEDASTIMAQNHCLPCRRARGTV